MFPLAKTTPGAALLVRTWIDLVVGYFLDSSKKMCSEYDKSWVKKNINKIAQKISNKNMTNEKHNTAQKRCR